jgi:AraC-like DNA-binding protein
MAPATSRLAGRLLEFVHTGQDGFSPGSGAQICLVPPGRVRQLGSGPSRSIRGLSWYRLAGDVADVADGAGAVGRPGPPRSTQPRRAGVQHERHRGPPPGRPLATLSGGVEVAGADGDQARLFRVPGLAGVEVLHARFVTHRYAPHFHEAVTIAVVDRGAAQFTSGNQPFHAGAGSMFVIPAGEVHTGDVASAGGYTYRVLYIDPDVVTDLLREIGHPARLGGAAPAPALVRSGTPAFTALAAAHLTLAGPATALERGHALLRGLAWLESELAGVPLARVERREHRAVRAAREYLDAHATEEVPLPELAAVGGLSAYRLARTFRAQVGLPPHAYQVQRRVLLAKALLAAGTPPAVAAARCGFADQAHLTRRFKALVGTTPGRYAREVGGAGHARG